MKRKYFFGVLILVLIFCSYNYFVKSEANSDVEMCSPSEFHFKYENFEDSMNTYSNKPYKGVPYTRITMNIDDMCTNTRTGKSRKVSYEPQFDLGTYKGDCKEIATNGDSKERKRIECLLDGEGTVIKIHVFELEFFVQTAKIVKGESSYPPNDRFVELPLLLREIR